MKLKDYKDAIFDYFGVSSLDEMLNRDQFKNDNYDWRTVLTWKSLYEQIFSYINLPEAGNLITLEGQKQEICGVLLEYNEDQSLALIQHFRSLSLHSQESWHQGWPIQG